MTKKIGKEGDNGKQKERDSLGPRAQGMGGKGRRRRRGEGRRRALSGRETGQSTGKKLCLLY